MATQATTIASGGRHVAPVCRECGKKTTVPEENGSIADVAMRTMYGILQHRYGRNDDALESCSAAVRAFPRYPPAHAGRALALAGLGRPDEAVDAFCDAIACDPECAPAHADYALMVTRLGCYEDAVAAYGDAIRLAPDSGDVYAGYAFALAGAGRLEDALAACKRAALLDPKSAHPHAARGRVMAGMGRFSEALSAFDQAVRLDEGSASAHAGRGLALESLGRHAEALSAYDRAVRLDEGSASAHAGRGLALESLGRHAEALSAYGRAIGIDEYHDLAREGIGRAERRAPHGAPDGINGPGSRGRQENHSNGPKPGGLPGRCAASIGRAMDPDHGSTRGYIQYCLSHAPRDDDRNTLREGSPRSPPLTAEEKADMMESASSNEAVTMDGTEFMDMIREGGRVEQ